MRMAPRIHCLSRCVLVSFPAQGCLLHANRFGPVDLFGSGSHDLSPI